MASERAKAIAKEREERERTEMLEEMTDRLAALENETAARFLALDAKLDQLLVALQPADAKADKAASAKK